MIRPPWSRRKIFAALALLAAAGCACSLPHVLSHYHGLFIDDTYIAYRFAENWGAGHGPVWNPGMPPVEGFTGFLWVAIGAALHWLTGQPLVGFFHYAGVLFWMLTCVLLIPAGAVRGIRTGEGVGPGSLPAALALVAATSANMFMAVHGMHGLETALHTFMLTLVAVAFMAPVSRSWMWSMALASFLAVTSRPDALALILPLYGLAFLYCLRRRDALLLVLGSGALFVGLCAIFIGAKWAYFGYPLPNAVYVKTSSVLLAGLSYVKKYFAFISLLFIPAGYGVLRAGPRAVLRDRVFVGLMTSSLLFFLAYSRFVPAAGIFYRFLEPAFPVFLLALYRLAQLSLERSPAPDGPLARLLRLDVAAVLCVVLAVFLSGIATKADKWADSCRRGVRVIDYVHTINGHNLAPAAMLDPQPVLAAGDVGATPYFSHLPTIDLIGLCDEHIAHQGLDAQYLEAVRPDIYILQDLYLKSPTDAVGKDDILIDVGGVKRPLDIEFYERIGVHQPRRRHSGMATTFTVVTMPGFTDEYSYAGDWVYGTRDRYYAFVRNAYPHADELAAMLERTSDDRPLFENSGFEKGDLTNWTASGDAFTDQPTYGDNIRVRKPKLMGNGILGDYWVGTYERHTANGPTPPGKVRGDKPQGTLVSAPFTIRGEFICFRIGGGKDDKDLTAKLVVDGKVVRKATGRNEERLKGVNWNVAAHRGKTAHIEIRDAKSGPWGHINVDDFHYE